MDLTVADILKASPLMGMSLMIFYMFIVGNKKDESLKQVIAQQTDVIRSLREDRLELLKIVRESSAVITKNTDFLVRLLKTKHF